MSTSKTTFNPLLEDGLQIISTTAETIADVTKDPTGWEDGDNITQTYDHTNRQVTLSHPSGTLSWWWKGERHTIASPWTSSAHAASDGLWFLKFTGDVSTENWALNTPWAFYEVQVFAVNYRASVLNSWGIREPHGLMPWQAHQELHSTVGTYWVSGLTLDPATYALNGTTDAENTYGVLSGVIKDEDSSTSIPAWSEGTYTVAYRNGVGGAWVFSTVETFPFIVAANTIQRNLDTAGTWSLSPVAEDNYVNYFDFAIPVSADADSQKYRHLLIMGQAQYTTLAAAQQEFPQNLDLGTLTDLSTEFVCVNRITYQFNASGLGAKTTTGRCAIQAVSPVRGSRASQVAASGAAPSNHSGLSGLANDDHLQYEHIQGRAAQVDTKAVNFAADANVGVYYVDTSGGNISVALPDPVTYPGKMFWFLNKSTNNITFTGYTIGGIANFTIDGNERLMVHSDGAAWRQLSRKAMAFWKTGVTFCKDHIIEVSEAGWEGIWRCVVQHTAAATFDTDVQAGNWDYMGGANCAQLINSVAHGFNTSEILYRKFDNTWQKAQANGAVEAEVFGVVAGVTANYFLLVTEGQFTRPSGSWSANTQYYLSDSSAGAGTATEPTANGSYSVPVYRTISTTVADVHIQRPRQIIGEAAVTIAANGTIDLSNAVGQERWYAVTGNAAGQNAMNVKPFGSIAPITTMTVWLVGTSNSNTVTIATNDDAQGVFVSGGFIELGKGTAICFKYSPTLARWIEIARNNATF